MKYTHEVEHRNLSNNSPSNKYQLSQCMYVQFVFNIVTVSLKRKDCIGGPSFKEITVVEFSHNVSHTLYFGIKII